MFSKLLENCQRTRMPPPPGFNHMNAFGFGVPRAQSSKILPFMNGMNGGSSNSQTPQQQQQNSWGQMPPPQQNMGYPSAHDQTQNHLSQQQNHQSNKAGTFW